jgi:hypothetical protein
MSGAAGRSVWARVKARLAARLDELSDEVRAYPSPIARCDDQLPKLLERRAAAHRSLRLANDQDVEGFSDAQFAALIAELTRDEDDEDGELAALRDQVLALASEKARSGV